MAFLTLLLPYAALIAAILVLIGTIYTVRMNVAIAKRNQVAAERQLEQKADHERLLSAQGRLFEPRAKVYLDARKVLAELEAINDEHYGMDVDYAPGWREKFSPSVRADLLNRLSIYGTPDAVSLFEQTWGHLHHATQGAATTHGLHQARIEEVDGRNNEIAIKGIESTRTRVQTQAEEAARQGYILLEQFTKVCQRDLAVGKQTLPLIEIDSM